MDKCQASRQELLKALNSMRAAAIENFWRILDFQYTVRCINQILQLIEDNSWDWRKFPFEETLDTLCVLEPRSILEIMLTDWFAERISNGFGLFSLISQHFEPFLTFFFKLKKISNLFFNLKRF